MRLLLGIFVVLFLFINNLEVNALKKNRVEAIAFSTTVLIDQGLQKGSIEEDREFNPGSGVIVSHWGRNYYVLTALHVVSTRDVMYGIRTYDGEVYLVDDVNTRTNIHYLGREENALEGKINGFDLALVKFQSEHIYRVAPRANLARLKVGDKLFISGWPEPENKNSQRKYHLSAGFLTHILNPPSTDGGYSLLYTNPTARGMSGGPIFNSEGLLVAIHGRGAGRENNCRSLEVNQTEACGIGLRLLLTYFW
jgi:serine protease Do